MIWLFFLACSTSHVNSDDSGLLADHLNLDCSTAPTFQTDIYPLFYDVCAACHYTEPEGLSFAHEDQMLMLVGVASSQVSGMNRVEPGSPDASYVWHKLQGTHKSVGGSGYKMPEAENFEIYKGLSSRHLTASEITDIEQWITCGAL